MMAIPSKLNSINNDTKSLVENSLDILSNCWEWQNSKTIL